MYLKLAQKRYILASAAAAGVSVAFGSPLGAVIFGLEGTTIFPPFKLASYAIRRVGIVHQSRCYLEGIRDIGYCGRIVAICRS